MPALLFMGRRWGVGGDEFALPSLCSMALRVVWSVALMVILFEVGADLSGCDDGWVVYAYLVCSLSTFALSVVVEWGITRVSTLGSIADTAPRASLSKYLNVHMMLGVFQFVMACLGVALVGFFDSTCHGVLTDQALNILLAVVVTSQLVDVMVTCCCCVLMRGNPHETVAGGDGGGHYERFPPTEIEGQWESRCHWLYRASFFLTCGLFGGQGSDQGDFEQLARVMARIFHTEEYLDVVPSDIAAGIVLLYHKQRQRSTPSAPPMLPNHNFSNGDSSSVQAGRWNSAVMRGIGGSFEMPAGLRARSREHKDFYKASRRRLLDVTRAEDLKALEEVAHFSRYALAIYTWYLYVFERPCCGACDLLCYSCTGRSRAFHKARESSAKTFADSSESVSSQDSSWSQAGGDSASRGGQRPDVVGVRGETTPAFHTGARTGERGGTAEMPPYPRNETSKRSGSAQVHVSVRGDNWLGTHEAGLLRVAGLHPACEVVDAQFKSGVKATPYCIMVDHAWRCVVISIRGTMSLDDCLCDLQAEPASMEAAGQRWGFDGSGMLAHQGVLGRAEWVREDLEREGHLRALLGGQARNDTAGFSGDIEGVEDGCGGGPGIGAQSGGADDSSGRKLPPAPPFASRRIRCNGYSLRITGHSLGGSTGALLTYMLRRDYPSARCISISPLGGLLNAPYAEQCEEFVLSAVLGDDVTPRLSVNAMERMRDEVLELIARSKVNKITVMRSLVRGRFGSRRDSTAASPSGDVFGLVYTDDNVVPRTDYYNQLRRYREWVDRKRQEWIFPELLPAGRFVHYLKTGVKSRCCRSELQFTPVWATNADFKEIRVSKRMFVDHFPNRTCPTFMETLKSLKSEAEDAEKDGAMGRGSTTDRGNSNGGDDVVPSPAHEFL